MSPSPEEMLELDTITMLKLRQMQRNEKDKRRHVTITIVLMLAGGISAEDIAYTFDIDISTIYRYAEKYRASKSIDEYLSDNYTRYDGKLSTEQRKQLEAELTSKLYTSAKEVCACISERFGVDYTPTGLVPLLKPLGFVDKKARQVPAKADPTAQQAFIETLSELISKAKNGDAALYFADATHPQHNTRPSNGWIKSGEDFHVRSMSGRHRLNINGALNALYPTRITVRTDERIDADSTIVLLKHLERRDRSKTICVVCDGARYYRSRAVAEWLDGSRIELVPLPAYSLPRTNVRINLNLIERLWRYLHQKAIDLIYYPTRKESRDAVLGFFNNIKQHKVALQSLLTLNFACFQFRITLDRRYNPTVAQ